MKKTHKLIPGLSLRYGHFSVNRILPSGVFDGGVARCKLQSSMVQNQKLFVVLPGKISSLSSPASAPEMLALETTLRLQRE
jgi:hypothetical protein